MSILRPMEVERDLPALRLEDSITELFFLPNEQGIICTDYHKLYRASIDDMTIQWTLRTNIRGFSKGLDFPDSNTLATYSYSTKETTLKLVDTEFGEVLQQTNIPGVLAGAIKETADGFYAPPALQLQASANKEVLFLSVVEGFGIAACFQMVFLHSRSLTVLGIQDFSELAAERVEGITLHPDGHCCALAQSSLSSTDVYNIQWNSIGRAVNIGKYPAVFALQWVGPKELFAVCPDAVIADIDLASHTTEHLHYSPERKTDPSAQSCEFTTLISHGLWGAIWLHQTENGVVLYEHSKKQFCYYPVKLRITEDPYHRRIVRYLANRKVLLLIESPNEQYLDIYAIQLETNTHTSWRIIDNLKQPMRFSSELGVRISPSERHAAIHWKSSQGSCAVVLPIEV